MSKKLAPYGTWDSSITPELMVASNIGLSQALIFGNELFWVESRPQDQGRSVICKRSICSESTATTDVLPAGYNCRTRVHEYGGACFLPTAHGVFFVNFEDQQIYTIDNNGMVNELTHHPDIRFADLSIIADSAQLVAVAEIHGADMQEPQNKLVSISISSGEIKTLHEGHDFYASADVSPDCNKLCWLTWDHPNMPWDGTDLWSADISEDGRLETVTHIAGSSTESIFQPQWSPRGKLYYVSDRSNWWNLYVAGVNKSLCPMDAEFGMPQWVFGMRRYAFIDDDNIVTSFTQNGVEGLAIVNLINGRFEELARDHSSYDSVHANGATVCYIAQSSVNAPSLYIADATDTERLVVCSSTLQLNPDDISVGQPVSYATANEEVAHGFFYEPENAKFLASEEELPPLVVMIHGGPTSATHNDLSLKIQFWTSRGFAVFDANYRGSTGYGRKYRDALKGQWGVTDVEDVDHAVQYLAGRNLIDPQRVAIRGGSAGGYTTLAALAGTDSFKAGTSLYGVTDLTALAKDTHKFESRYLDSLIGPYPEEEALYLQRSPINQVDTINSPVIFLQGLDDKVVPPNQAEMMIEALLEKGIRVAYVPFEGEGHGFRQSENIIKAFNAELWFYAKVFGFDSKEVEGVAFMEN